MKLHHTGSGLRSEGVSLVEVLLVISIVGLLLRIVTFNLFQSQQRISLVTTKNTLVRDLQDQQQKAMTGTTDQNGASVDYSVYFEAGQYTLFPGSIYSAANSANVVVPLDPIFRFSTIQFPQSSITFARLSGDPRNYSAGTESVMLSDTETGNSFTITINPRGVVLVQ